MAGTAGTGEGWPRARSSSAAALSERAALTWSSQERDVTLFEVARRLVETGYLSAAG